MKIAVIISNISFNEEIKPLQTQSVEYDLFYFTENTLPFPLPNLDSRMKGKYFKTQAHKFLDHDIFIHLDSSIEVTEVDFIAGCIEKLQASEVVIGLHKQRNSPYDELEYIIAAMKGGNRYLLRRYAKQPLYAEYAFYKDEELPKDYPLYQCSFFARLNNDKVNKAFDCWWDTIMRYSNFDQTQFSYAAWLHGLNIANFDIDKYMIRHKHPGYNL